MRLSRRVSYVEPSAAHITILRTVNASELERLKKRFMKLDRCAPHCLVCLGESQH